MSQVNDILTINILMAQLNPIVGDIDGNTQMVIDSVHQAESEHKADVVVFTELTLCGYPPEDLLLRESMATRIELARQKLAAEAFKSTVILGYPQKIEGKMYNMAGVLQNGQWIASYAKQELPNYQVFDEKRYFTAGTEPCVIDLYGIPTAITVCEDIWHKAPLLKAKDNGAQLMINLNASPYHQQKQYQRLELLEAQAKLGEMPIVYVNQAGGQDELVFDGASFAVSAKGECRVQAPQFEEGLFPVTVSFNPATQKATIEQGLMSSLPNRLSSIYQALTIGVRDYVTKNGFKHVVLGLSGGIDSALTLAIAVDALGADRVTAVMMPFTYTSQLSQNDAQKQAATMGVEYKTISIKPMYDAFMAGLSDSFAGTEVDLTEQNLQARCRGVILMALSNKTGAMVLTTGNKSEMAVGYSTLYGDMAGGFDVLKDVPKMTVFELAKYRNTLGEAIPVSVIERPPSAELAPDQKDEDNLPSYEILDQILEAYIEQDQSADAIIAQGFDEQTVYRVIRLVDINEYKRRQAPVGVRISQKGFGRDRRYPITNGWKAGV